MNNVLSDDIIKKQITNTLTETDFSLGKRYKGKVRDNYVSQDDKQMIIITTDRISCFDHIVGTVPFKGQVLNQIAAFWFEKTRDIAENHIIDIPDPNVMVVKKCEPLPVEMIVRGYITGSLWREYEKGTRELYGLKFENNMKKDQKFSEPVITPTTKAEQGSHDTPISKNDIINNGLVSKDIYEEMEKISLKLFDKGTRITEQNGLILVDTKYEFGILDNKLILIDEIHTPDSSRFWHLSSYKELFEKGAEQKILDKEYVRQWLISRGFMGTGKSPKLTDDVKVEACKRYIEAYEKITGKEFRAETDEDILERIRKNLQKWI